MVDIKDNFSTEELQTAIENSMSINFAMFKAQVVSYLEPQCQRQYSDAAIWDAMQLAVCDYLGQLS